MHQSLDPVGPILQLAIHDKLDAFISVDDAANAVANDKNCHDENEHHGHLEKR